MRPLAALCLLAFAAVVGAEDQPPPPSPPFDAADYKARYGHEAFEGRVVPFLAASAPLEDGRPRFALGDAEAPGALVDRSAEPPRRLRFDEVELLLLLREAGAAPGTPEERARLRRTAALARLSPELLGGPAQAARAAEYLEAVASGATDRVAPPGILGLARSEKAPPDAPEPADQADEPRRGYELSAPAPRMTPDQTAPPPSPARAGAAPSKGWAYKAGLYWAALAGMPSGAVQRVVGYQRRERDAALAPRVAEGAARLGAAKTPAELEAAVGALGTRELAGVAGVREALLKGVERVEKESQGKAPAGWSLALPALARSLGEQGALDYGTALRLVEAAANMTGPGPNGPLGINIDAVLKEVVPILNLAPPAGEDPAEGARRRARFDAARARIVDAFLPDLVARFKVPNRRPTALFDLTTPMFQGDARVMKVMLGEVEAMSKDPKGKDPAYVMFMEVVRNVAAPGRPLDRRAALEVQDAVRRMDLLAAPRNGSTGDYWTYIRVVETARNSLRGSTMPAGEKSEALDRFDADFAKGYDAGRAPVEARAALAKVLEVGPAWLSKGSMAGGFPFLTGQSGVAYDLALRETAARFFDRAGATNAEARTLAEATRAARAGRAGATPKDEKESPDMAAIRASVSPEVFAKADAFLAKADGSAPPSGSVDIYLESYRLENLRSALASLPEGDERRAALKKDIAARGRALAGGMSLLASLDYEKRSSGAGGSLDQTHARMTALLALPPEFVPKEMTAQTRDWLDKNGPLAATYTAFGKRYGPNDDLERGGAAQNVMMNLFAYRSADTPKEREKRVAGLEAALGAFARHEPVLRATMHRYLPVGSPHFEVPVGDSGGSGLAPYYYPSTIPRVIEGYAALLADPAVKADPKRLARAQEGYRTVRDGLLKEFDLKTGLREPLRRDLPWFYTLLGTGLAEVAALEAAGVK